MRLLVNKFCWAQVQLSDRTPLADLPRSMQCRTETYNEVVVSCRLDFLRIVTDIPDPYYHHIRGYVTKQNTNEPCCYSGTTDF